MKTSRPPAFTSSAQPASEARPFVVVGIGASAGGLKALQQFVAAVPADSGMAFVIIVHLDPERESRMGELLQDRASVPVTQVNGATPVVPNHIYIIPPGHDLTIRATMLALRKRGQRSAHAPVDLFFRTLAEECGADAVGVILSGTGADGTAGIRHIREAGGITIAQSPDEADHTGMPASAIATGLVDVVLPARKIPSELLRLRRVPLTDGDGEVTPITADVLARILDALRARTGHDFSLYKPSMVMRRLDRRRRFNAVTSLKDYLPLVQSSSIECQALLRDLLISVSSFFRDPDAFAALAALAPALFEGKGSADTIRVWVVGCATGEEVYSIAILLAEHAATLPDPPRIQMFATDIDEHGYTSSRTGLYPAAAVANVSSERLRRFFVNEADGYRVAKSVRELILFAGHNVLHDPPFSRMDLISCRNLFIYLQPEAQERVLDTFQFALNPAGLLFLGASESVLNDEQFVTVDERAHRIFRRSGSNRVLPRTSAADPVSGNGSSVAVAPTAHSVRQDFSYGAAHLRLLEQYAPASVIVDEHLDVVHLSPGAGSFLRLGVGEPRHHLIGLVHGDLRRVLRTALHHAFDSGAPTTRRVRVNVDGRVTAVNVQVRAPTVSEDAPGKLALILFEIAETSPPAAPADEAAIAPSVEAELEDELQRTRDLLEDTGAAHDRTVAELQIANEELRSINEEQKAAAEELETSREEIQSINEELTTINQEHQSTIEELKRTNADLQNLIESTEIGTIFLDRAMRIRRFTPAVGALFNFVAADKGRPLSHITHHLHYPSLAEDVANVLASLQRIEREVESDTADSYIVRISPYRSPEGANEGVVLTFFDNTTNRRIRQELQQAKIDAESANLAKSIFLSTLSHEFRSPLTGILGYADLLNLDPLTAQQEQRVERIKKGCWHLANMIDDILSFAKLEGGARTFEPEALDAREIAHEAGALIEPAAGVKGLAFNLDLPDARVALITDRAKARQILINLCGNAVKYTAAGEVRLRVRSDVGHVIFDVTDTGIGIARDHHSLIFDRFWQVDAALTRTAGGLGIGLAAAREYARFLGGDVEVDSELGSGSTFRLWLPAP